MEAIELDDEGVTQLREIVDLLPAEAIQEAKERLLSLIDAHISSLDPSVELPRACGKYFMRQP